MPHVNGAKGLRVGISRKHRRDVERPGDAALHEVQAAERQQRRDVGRSRRAGHTSAAAVGVDLVDFERQLLRLPHLRLRLLRFRPRPGRVDREAALQALHLRQRILIGRLRVRERRRAKRERRGDCHDSYLRHAEHCSRSTMVRLRADTTATAMGHPSAARAGSTTSSGPTKSTPRSSR